MPSGPIIVAVHGQSQTAEALALGEQLAQVFGAPLVLAGVYEVEPWLLLVKAAQYVDRIRQREEDVLEAARLQLASPDRADTRLVGAPSVANGLHTLAVEQRASALVLGRSHGVGIARRLLPGGTAERLLHGAPCPVIVAGVGDANDTGPVAVGYDAAPESDAALDWALELVGRVGGSLALWHVSARTAPEHDRERYREFTEYIHGIAERMLERGVRRVAGSQPVSTAVMEGDPGAQLAHRAKREGATWIVCGSRGYGPARSVLLGSTARSLLDHATCPVAVIPRPAVEEPEPSLAGTDETSEHQEALPTRLADPAKAHVSWPTPRSFLRETFHPQLRELRGPSS
jgi:nucleotide-binding universal stress UspA family protein